MTDLNRMAGRVPVSAIATAVEAALIIALAYVGAALLWVWLTPAPPYAQVSSIHAADTQTGPSPMVMAASMFDPFHRIMEKKTPAVAQTAAAPKTLLDLKLFGVRAGVDQATGSAIIRTPGQKQHAVKVGQDIVNGTKLVGVFKDHVLIERRSGVRESLYFDGADATGKSVPATGGQRTAGARANVASSAPAKGRGVQPKPAAQAAADVGDVGDATHFLKFVTLKPRIRDNRVHGLYIEPKGKGGVFFEKLGLKSGDVVLSINRVKMVGLAKLERLKDRLSDAKTLEFVIERDGEEQTLTHDVEALRG